MTNEEKQDLKRRAALLLKGPVPVQAASGTALQGHLYREDCVTVAAYLRRGVGADKARLAVLRMEGLRGAAAIAETRSGPLAAAPAIDTPSSNTGVNEVSGSGRGLERGYARAAARISSLALIWN